MTWTLSGSSSWKLITKLGKRIYRIKFASMSSDCPDKLRCVADLLVLPSTECDFACPVLHTLYEQCKHACNDSGHLPVKQRYN